MTEQSEQQPTQNSDLSRLIILLLKGVLYQENNTNLWTSLLNLQSQLRDYVSVIGLELAVDEAEGYAFLRARAESDEDTSSALPRLVARRPLSFAVSLLLALLRKKLAEFDAVGDTSGGSMRLIMSRADILELVRVFLPDASNEARLTDQIETHINKIIELGFLRKLKASHADAPPTFEVKRIIKAFVDAQWLSEFDTRLAAYKVQLVTESNDE